MIVFCISLLNIFIAVHGRAYEQAHSHATNLFLQDPEDLYDRDHCTGASQYLRALHGPAVDASFPGARRDVTDVSHASLPGRASIIAWVVLSVIFVGLWVLCAVIEARDK